MTDPLRAHLPEDILLAIDQIERGGATFSLSRGDAAFGVGHGSHPAPPGPSARIKTADRSVFGRGQSLSDAAREAIERYQETPWTVGAEPKAVRPPRGNDWWEWEWLVTSARGRTKTCRVTMSDTLYNDDSLDETPGGVECVATSGRSAVAGYLGALEPPTTIEMRRGQDALLSGYRS